MFFRLFTQVHLLIDGSVEGQYIAFLSKMNKPIYYYILIINLLLIICLHTTGFKYCYVTVTIK